MSLDKPPLLAVTPAFFSAPRAGIRYGEIYIKVYCHCGLRLLSSDMTTARFEWDERKNRQNYAKYGVEFGEAQ